MPVVIIICCCFCRFFPQNRGVSVYLGVVVCVLDSACVCVCVWMRQLCCARDDVHSGSTVTGKREKYPESVKKRRIVLGTKIDLSFVGLAFPRISRAIMRQPVCNNEYLVCLCATSLLWLMFIFSTLAFEGKANWFFRIGMLGRCRGATWLRLAESISCYSCPCVCAWVCLYSDWLSDEKNANGDSFFLHISTNRFASRSRRQHLSWTHHISRDHFTSIDSTLIGFALSHTNTLAANSPSRMTVAQ